MLFARFTRQSIKEKQQQQRTNEERKGLVTYCDHVNRILKTFQILNLFLPMLNELLFHLNDKLT